MFFWPSASLELEFLQHIFHLSRKIGKFRMNKARLPFTLTSQINHSLAVLEFQQSSFSLFPLLLLWGSCHHHALGGLWVAYMVLCWSCPSCQGGWSPHEEQGLVTQGCCQLSVETLVHLFCLVWQLVADTSCSVSHTSVLSCKLSAGSSSIPRQSSVHSSCSAVEVNPHLLSFSSSLPVLPKEPVSHHCSTPNVSAILSCLHDPRKITDCICTQTF